MAARLGHLVGRRRRGVSQVDRGADRYRARAHRRGDRVGRRALTPGRVHRPPRPPVRAGRPRRARRPGRSVRARRGLRDGLRRGGRGRRTAARGPSFGPRRDRLGVRARGPGGRPLLLRTRAGIGGAGRRGDRAPRRAAARGSPGRPSGFAPLRGGGVVVGPDRPVAARGGDRSASLKQPYWLPRPVKPLMGAEWTPVPLQSWGSDGVNVSTPSALAPAYMVVFTVWYLGCPGLGWRAFSSTLGATVPCSWTAAAADCVWYLITV